MVGVYFVGDGEVVGGVDFYVFADVSDTGKYTKIFTEVFFDSFGFGGGLDDN